MIRAECSIVGRVQGVGFRATARDTAKDFAVQGWVRNERDGSVFLVAEGESAEIDRFLERLKSRMNRFISTVDRRDCPPMGERGFEIAR